MLILSQRDGRWGTQKLGLSNCTVGRYGCTTTCISMISDFFLSFYDPGRLARLLGYNLDGYIIWGSLSRIKLKLDERGYGRDDAKIKQALKDPKTCVILQVQGNHWVLAMSARLFGGYNIADPWYGDQSTTARYKNQITGFAIISKL